MRWQQDGRWHRLHYVEVSQRVRRIARGLREVGVASGDRVALLSANIPEWSLCDYALMSLHARQRPPCSPAHPPRRSPVCWRTATRRILLVAGEEPARRALEVLDQGKLDYLVFLDGEPAGLTPEQHVRVRTLEELEEKGELDEEELLRDLAQSDPEELATLIYTSGHHRQSQRRDAEAQQFLSRDTRHSRTLQH